MSEIIYFTPAEGLVSQLHDALHKCIKDEKYDRLTAAELIGVLEFLKFNIINGANGN